MTVALHIITGPTAVGKTDYALEYAEARGAEILSCDASLVYRGMDIGTAKPSPDELARVPHHLIDVCEVDEPYDIVRFDREAHAVVEDVLGRGKPVVVTGGSGFYLKSFLAPVIDEVEVSNAVREEVAALYETGGLPALLEALQLCSPDGLGHLDTRNPRRVLRALERCRASGRSLPELQRAFAARPLPYGELSKKLILLDRDPEDLRERVARRAACMLSDGLIEEVRHLREAGIERNPSAASAIGYRETLAYLDGRLSREALLPAIVQNTQHLVKKQRTWFRSQIGEPDERVQLGA
ncbi:tRNA (adenosine(37)-N6)-dimethylallyltransferase MiaA [Coraliomargarita parva]|uniref:tRNA (adenosine(37)-N6)-dimethylallyltransferase MiaA n=1 Tax=Coraliomargarita parva TaxID=3014050 RepID=UPI0022B48266|nr:tRNA (adenosine(37)-N6)-dimethylallyltransferase MiaA [Coraliomargarita parva]